MGNKYEMTYDSNGLLETFKNPKGLINSFDYDSKGNLLKDDNTAGHSWVFELLTNDPGSNLKVKSSSQMNREQITSTTYQGDGFTRQNLTKPSGAETRYIYNRYFRETRHPNGHTVGNSKTSDPRFFDQTHLNNALNINTGFINYFISYSYSAQYSLQNFLFLDSETSSHTFQNQTWQRIYDGVTGEYVYKSPLLREQKVKLNDYDQVIETQDTSFLPMSYSYDTLGRLSTISQGSRTWTYAYNADYEVESITNPKSEVISYEYDNNGRLIKSTLANSDEVTYSYDDNGNLTGIKAGSGPWHNFIVSAWDAVLSYVFPSIASETHEIEYEYNLDKQLTKVTKPGGIEIDYIYGASTGKLNQIVTPEGNYNYVYNLLRDQLTSLSSPDLANLSYMYNADELSRQRLVYNTLTTDTEFTYDSLLPESQTVKSTDVDSDESSTISYTYDGDRLLTGAGDLSLTRNLTTGLIEEVSLGSNMLETYTYDTSYPELSQMQAEHGTSSILSETYTRDALGRITDVAETTASTSATYTYEYDARGRLEKVYLNSNLQRHYFYDENSNRLKIEDGSSNVLVSATYDNQDRVTSYGDYTFTYTDYGHRNEKLNTATDIKEAIEYDSMGALVSYVKEDTSSSTTLTEIDYINDGFGRRIQKTKDGLATKRYIYDAGIRLVGEVTPDGDTLTHYVYADKSHVPSYMIRGGNKYKLITNAQGSVRYVVNESTGSIEQEITYDEFGQVLSDSNPGFQSFGFAGGIYDPDTKLVRFGARDYDAETGRWTSKDPILFGGGDTNLYGYVMSDPINLIDPSGLKPPHMVPFDISKNISEARNMSAVDFYNAVKTGGKWDYKQYGRQYENLGNYNYGMTGKACGFGDTTLKAAAGLYQIYRGTSEFRFYDSYFDDPNDQSWIKEGIGDYNNNYWGL